MIFTLSTYFMHRNTATTIAGLSVIAALLFGINVGRKIPRFDTQPPANQEGQQLGAQTKKSDTSKPTMQPLPLATASPAPAASDSATLGAQTTYTNDTCGYSTSYPSDWLYTEHTVLTTTFSDPTNSGNQISIICQADIPRPAVEPKLVESFMLGTVRSEMYHDTDPSTGNPLTAVIATVPGKELDIIISGNGPEFDHVLANFSFVE